MISKEMILNRIEKIEYIDFHIHMEDYSPEHIDDRILYIANGVDRESYNSALRLSSEKENVVPIFGIHPAFCQRAAVPDDLQEKIFSRSILIGEIGLDYHWIEDKSTYPAQRDIFARQMALASRYKCIPNIHTKGAEKEILETLSRAEISKSVIHWYSGPGELIEDYLEQGCYFTIGPDVITGSEVYRSIPLDRMFAETDNPTGMPWILGGDDKADDIIKVYKALAEKLGMSEEKLIKQFKENMKDLLSDQS